MRRVWPWFVLSGIFLVLSPATADAQVLKLHRLSGPEFKGVLGELRLQCWPSERDRPFDILSGPGVIWSLCDTRTRRRTSVNLDVGVLWATEAQFNNGDRMWMVPFGLSASHRINELIEVGTGIHMAFFSTNNSTVRLMLEPGRVDLRPLRGAWGWDPLATPEWWQDGLVLRGGLFSFPQGFDPGTFGAPIDDAKAVYYWGVFFDTEALLRGRRRQ
jgi:hypothetical protein